jgi:hypothetical protein
MKGGLTRSQKRHMFVAIISFLIIICAFGVAYAVTVRQVEGKYQSRLEAAQNKLNQNRKMVYVAKNLIASGSTISKDNTKYVEAFSNIPIDYFITDKDFGKLAVVNIGKDTQVLKNMVAADTMPDDLREEEFECVTLNTNLSENDYADIRIMFPNGENYVVLPKKPIKNLSLKSNQCYLWLNEEEIVTISSAIIDAYLHKGAKLYTAKYIEPSIQEANKVTYIPNVHVINMMRQDTNIYQIASKALSETARKEMEIRLDAFKKANGELNLTAETNQTVTDQTVTDQEATKYYVDDLYNSDAAQSEEEEKYVQ